MKKTTGTALACTLAALMISLTACGSTKKTSSEAPVSGASEVSSQSSLKEASSASGKKAVIKEKSSGEQKVHYADIMVPYDEVEKSDRIVVLQTSLVYNGRDGIYTEDEVEAPVEITYEGTAVSAFKMKNSAKFLNSKPEGDVTVVSKDGSTVKISGADFLKLYVLSKSGDEFIKDFQKGTQILLVKESGELVSENFDYAVTFEGEGVISVSSKDEIGTDVILEEMGWDPEAAVNIVATDKFYVPDEVIDGARGTVTGVLSGTTVNAKIRNTDIAQGKINDIIYIEKIVSETINDY